MEPMPKTWYWFRQTFTLVYQNGGLFEFDIVDLRPGLAVLQINGPIAEKIFKSESGGHRWQRVPPTEKNGRVQTSTITVAVLDEPAPQQLVLNQKDLHIVTCRGAGKGGQNRNKVETAVQITHVPTGTTVRCETERSQGQNKEIAIKTLRARIWQSMKDREHQKTSNIRNSQIGTGMRGDKRRTIQVQNNIVKDHLNGKRWRYEDYCAGKGWDLA